MWVPRISEGLQSVARIVGMHVVNGPLELEGQGQALRWHQLERSHCWRRMSHMARLEWHFVGLNPQLSGTNQIMQRPKSGQIEGNTRRCGVPDED